MKFEVDIEVQTSLQAYMDFKFHVSQSRTSIQAYVDLNSHAVFTTTRGHAEYLRGSAAKLFYILTLVLSSTSHG